MKAKAEANASAFFRPHIIPKLFILSAYNKISNYKDVALCAA